MDSPIFAAFIPRDSSSASDSILAVFKTGEIFLLPVDNDRLNYRMFPFKDAAPWYNPLIESGLDDANFLREIFERDHVVYNASADPVCVASFQPPEDFTQVEVEFSNNFLIVKGAMYKNCLSIIVYTLSNSTLTRILIEPMIAVADITYCSYFSSLLVVPRASSTAIALIPSIDPAPPGFRHRLLKDVIFAGAHLKRTVHVSASGIMKWHAVSWSDDLCPSIIWWRFSPPGEEERSWEAVVCDIMTECFISHLKLDEKSNRIGFIMERNDEIAICVWDFSEDTIKQFNLGIDGIGEIIAAGWIRSATSSEMIYAVSAKTGYYEHQRDKIIRWENPLYTLNTVCSDSSGDRFFFSATGELRTVLAADFYEGLTIESVKVKKLPQLPLTENRVIGDCDSLSCLHLYRCRNCRRPLLFPLVATSQDSPTISTCYCGPECQRANWPAFCAIYQDI